MPDASELEFTRDQKRAIKHSKGHMRIIACPGSGKTEVVSRQVAGLVRGGADPKTIIAFTFTEKAAEELKTRIRRILDEDCPDADVGDMFVGTIHAFCFHMLKEIAPEFRSYDILDEARRIAFISKTDNFFTRINLRSLEEHHNLNRHETLTRFIDSVEIMMTEDIKPARLSDKMFKKCYEDYKTALEEERYFDFSYIMYRFVEYFKRNKARKKLLAERVRHVILDEYQDVNNMQESILELLSDGAESVCVVGDDDQSIYNWRGSNASMMAGFKDRYKDRHTVTDCTLAENFRSTDAIVDTARRFIENNQTRLKKRMVKSKRLEREYEDGDLFYKYFDREEDEFKFILRRIRDLQGTDFTDRRNNPFAISLGDMAVLVRTNSDATRITEFLDANGIPCIAYSGTNIFERPVVRLAADCIGYVFDCRGYTSDDVPEIGDLKARYAEIFGTRYPKASARRFASRLEAVRDGVRTNSTGYMGGLGLQGYYHRILNAMGAGDFEFGDVFHFNLAQLGTAISDYESVRARLQIGEVESFFYFVTTWAEAYYADAQHADATNIRAVNILTYHKAKGLEFPIVFMPCFVKPRKHQKKRRFVDDSLFDSDMYAGTEEDVRRVYYVAMTRSEKYLSITGSGLRDGLVRKKSPNPLAREIVNDLFSDRMTIRRKRSGHAERTETAASYPTSFTQLGSYERCPQDFRLRHVFGYNPGVPASFGFGTNIHNILGMIHTDYIRKKRPPTDAEIDEIFDRVFKLRYATGRTSERMKRAGINIVKNYVWLHRNDLGRILETEKNFEFALGDALISGQIDLLNKVDDKGAVKEVEIIDFKTEKKDGVYETDHAKQLRLYAIACIKSLGLKPEKALVHHLDNDTKTEIDISEKVLEETKAGIQDDVSGVLARKFPPKPSKKVCTGCDYKLICPFKTGASA